MTKKRKTLLRTMAGVAALVISLARAATSAVVTVEKSGSDWTLQVDGQPFFVRGIGYSPERVGEDPNVATLRNWMFIDDNGNGLVDTAYESFIDVNENNLKDASEPAVGDWALLRDMGVNTIRVYHHPSNDPSVQAGYGSQSSIRQFNAAPNKAIFRDLFANYGIRVAMGDFLGAYTIGSGDKDATDYTNATHRSRILASVRQMVTDFKDEPWLLMYLLGNENNLPITFTNANVQRAAYQTLVEEAAQLIKSLDPNHPVGLVIGDADIVNFINDLETNAPSVDIIGANVYRYSDFASFFTDAASAWDRPVLFTEYGDLQSEFDNEALDESRQQTVHEAAVDDIEANAAGGAGTDTSIGGIAFAWLDSWWQNGSAGEHDIVENYPTTVDNEWHGMASQGNGARSPFLRQLRDVYYEYQDRWATASRFIGAGGGSTSFRYLGFESSLITLSVPAGAFPSGARLAVQDEFVFPFADSTVLDLFPTGVGFQLTEDGGQQPAAPVTIYFPIDHDGDGLVLARYDAENDVWIPLPTRRDADGVLIAQTTHFSFFQVMASLPTESVSRGIAYPNPARPSQGHTDITFAQAPPGSRIRLFTAAGELVRELSADAAGVASWNLRNQDGREAASGVYFALFEGDGGEHRVSVAVQR